MSQAQNDKSTPKLPAASHDTDQVTGSVISLITNAQVRYEGTLVKIDKAARSMHLQNVKSFGSEGRRDGQGEIPGSDTVQPAVIFKVDHIKDFKIIKRASAQKAEFQDPAIMATQPVKEVTSKPAQPQQQPKEIAPKKNYPERPEKTQGQGQGQNRNFQKPAGPVGKKSGANPNEQLQAQFKDSLNFDQREIHREVKQDEPEKEEGKSSVEDNEESVEKEEVEAKPSDGFFDTMSNSTLITHPVRGGRGGRGQDGQSRGNNRGRGGYQGRGGNDFNQYRGNRGDFSQRGDHQQRGGYNRGGYQNNRGDRGGYYNNREDRGYQNDREGGYQNNGFERNGYQNDRAERGGYQNDRSDRGGYQNDRSERGGYQNDRGNGFQNRGGYQNENNRGGRGNYRGRPNTQQNWRKDSETFGKESTQEFQYQFQNDRGGRGRVPNNRGGNQGGQKQFYDNSQRNLKQSQSKNDFNNSESQNKIEPSETH